MSGKVIPNRANFERTRASEGSRWILQQCTRCRWSWFLAAKKVKRFGWVRHGWRDACPGGGGSDDSLRLPSAPRDIGRAKRQTTCARRLEPRFASSGFARGRAGSPPAAAFGA